MFVMFIDVMSAEEARQELQRRRKALELEAMQTQSFESLCSVAHRLGELCEHEDALNNPSTQRLVVGAWTERRQPAQEEHVAPPLQHHD